jgi:hypothetical protein
VVELTDRLDRCEPLEVDESLDSGPVARLDDEPVAVAGRSHPLGLQRCDEAVEPVLRDAPQRERRK